MGRRPRRDVVTVDRLRAALGSGALLRHLFRYREARILTHRLETIGRPLKLALFLRLLSRGAVRGRGRIRTPPAAVDRLIARWAWQAMREPFKKAALLAAMADEVDALVAAAQKPRPSARSICTRRRCTCEPT